MAKVKKAYFCKECGYEASKWMGRCPSCGEWNSFTEEVIAKTNGTVAATMTAGLPRTTPQRVGEIRATDRPRLDLGNPEVVLSEEAVLPMLYYFLWGAAAAYLAVETGGFEAPCAMHAVNNLYIALIVNYPDSAMPTEALLIDSTPASSITTLLYALLAFIVIHGLSVWRGYIEEGFRWQGRSRAGS